MCKVNSVSLTHYPAQTGLCSLPWCTGRSGSQFAVQVKRHTVGKLWRLIMCSIKMRTSCLFGAKGLTAGVLLAKVLRSLRLVLIKRLVLLMCRLTLWLAAWAMRTPRLQERAGACWVTHAHTHTQYDLFPPAEGSTASVRRRVKFWCP